MNAPWRYFAGLVAGFLLVFGATVAAFYLNLGVPSRLSSWAFQLTQKKRALAAQASSPKLLIVGGSATLFGISAKEIECETGYRSINLANHAALGPTYMLREAQRAAKSGDTVLLAFEYELYDLAKWNASGRTASRWITSCLGTPTSSTSSWRWRGGTSFCLIRTSPLSKVS